MINFILNALGEIYHGRDVLKYSRGELRQVSQHWLGFLLRFLENRFRTSSSGFMIFLFFWSWSNTHRLLSFTLFTLKSLIVKFTIKLLNKMHQGRVRRNEPQEATIGQNMTNVHELQRCTENYYKNVA